MSYRGAALLETIVALAILATVATAGAWLASESLRAVSHVHQEEARVRSAERFLSAVSLWPREDLDRHMGWSLQGPWRLRVDRPRRFMYVVSLTDTLSGAVALGGAVFRGEAER
jgi:type II secretory pathway pseudopilin PulG